MVELTAVPNPLRLRERICNPACAWVGGNVIRERISEHSIPEGTSAT